MKPLAEMGRYATVVIDPPWHMPAIGMNKAIRGRTVPNFSPVMPYATMKLDEIESLPVEHVLEVDAVVFCWTTNRMLPNTFSIIEAWGCSYSFTMSWVKNAGIQTPSSPCFNTEFIVVGRKGRTIWMDTKAFNTANYWPRGEHSAKPEGFYDLLRRVTPAPRLDIFGRRLIGGFDSWGNEVPEGEPPPDSHQQVLVA